MTQCIFLMLSGTTVTSGNALEKLPKVSDIVFQSLYKSEIIKNERSASELERKAGFAGGLFLTTVPAAVLILTPGGTQVSDGFQPPLPLSVSLSLCLCLSICLSVSIYCIYNLYHSYVSMYPYFCTRVMSKKVCSECVLLMSQTSLPGTRPTPHSVPIVLTPEKELFLQQRIKRQKF